MIEFPVEFEMPEPWSGKPTYRFERFGALNFLVGPNGSGKSRFAAAMREQLPNSRLLGTDRLSGMERIQNLGVWGDNINEGWSKGQFKRLTNMSSQHGFGADAFILLEQRLDLRLQVEATLSQLFNRQIMLEWDSGNLVPRAMHGNSSIAYRLDKDECHGIKELLVVLAHLYNDDHKYLFIDEPELNLHPQLQSFLMQEIRRYAGDPAQPGRKAVFLITHSPFIIDLRSLDDLRSVISFDLSYGPPRHMLDLDDNTAEALKPLIPRLNVHHKQLFFSDNPIFVEGVLDANLVEAMQENRGFSVSSAGSCIIDAGGCEEVNKYVTLCRCLGKSAHFLYDLDALFTGTLRACIKSATEITDFLAAAGLGREFGEYCGQLDKKLTDAIRKLRGIGDVPQEITELRAYLDELSGGGTLSREALQKARVAVLVQMATDRDSLSRAIGDAEVNDIEGRLGQVANALKQKNVHLLTGGALEHFLPSYTGPRFKLEDGPKRTAVDAEIVLLSTTVRPEDLPSRYGKLFDAVAALPSKAQVDTEPLLKHYLGDFVYKLQTVVVENPTWDHAQVQAHLSTTASELSQLFTLGQFRRADSQGFRSTINVKPIGLKPARQLEVDENTNAGMQRFEMIVREAAAEAAE